jgi:hypothetical protein
VPSAPLIILGLLVGFVALEALVRFGWWREDNAEWLWWFR